MKGRPPGAKAPQTRSAALFLALAAAVTPAVMAAQEPPLWTATLDAEIRRVMEALEIPGLAMAVVKDGQVVLARGYGVREVGRPGAVDPNTLFAAGSTSKAFTAAAVGILVDESRVRWDDPVTLHLPAFQLHDPYATRHMTVRDLLSHRSGLGRRADALWYGTGYDRSELLRRIRHLEPLPSGFRAGMGYQNIMYLAAGEVVGRVAGSTWDDFVKERIFAPLGMRSSGTSPLELPAGGNVAMPHVRRDGSVVSVPYRNLDNVGPAGSINSSVSEMAQWVRMLLGGGEFEGRRLPSDSTHRELFQPHVVSPVPSQLAEATGIHFRFYGLGWVLEDYRGRFVAWHNGGIDGMHAQVALLPGEGVESARQAAARAAVRLEESRAPDTRPALALAAYGGLYENDLYGRVTLLEEGGRLVLEDFAGRMATLEHWHHDTFRLAWEDPMLGRGFLTFGLDAAGRSALLTMEAFQPGSFRRVPGEDGSP